MAAFADTRRLTAKPTRRQLAQLDRLIEQLYYRHASGRQINVLNIGKVYAAVRAAAATGHDLDAAMVAAVAQYCEVTP